MTNLAVRRDITINYEGMWRMQVIIADDQPEVRSALKLILEEKPGVVVANEAGTSCDLLKQIKANCPELVLLDWELPGTNPAELISILRTQCPHLLVVALSSRPQMRKIALEAGAHDFVCKSDPPELLFAALDKCSGLS